MGLPVQDGYTSIRITFVVIGPLLLAGRRRCCYAAHMESAVTVLLGIALACVVLVLATGVFSFTLGNAWYQRNANRLMNLRVAAQFVAVVAFALLVWLRG